MTPGQWRSLGEHAPTWPGKNWPLGATWTTESTNFAVYAPDATDVWLCTFDDEDDSGGERRFPLTEHSLGIWHGALPGRRAGHPLRLPGQWTVGSRRTACGSTRGSCCSTPTASRSPGTITAGPEILAYDVDDPSEPSSLDSAPAIARSVVVDPTFDWEGDRPIQRRWRDTVIYELHVKGYTKLHDRIPEEIRGTYAGLGHPAVTDYLKDLGVTAVELLPVHQFFSEPALLERGPDQLLGLQQHRVLLPDAATARPETAASRSPSSSRW